jgi:hypothetical protein
MVLLLNKNHFKRRYHIKNQSGRHIIHGGSLSTIITKAGLLASRALSNVDTATLAKTLGGLALGGLGAYGVGKAANYFGKVVHDAMVEPPLTVDTPPQGTFKGDILPVRNTMEIIDPSNHTIDLPDGKVKSTNTIMYKNNPMNNVYRYGQGLKGKRKSGGNLNKILNNKSKDILNGLLSGQKHGKGIYQI